MESLAAPELIRCYFDTTFVPHLSAMELRWHPDGRDSAERVWHLPCGVSLHSAAPSRFGITVERQSDNDYLVRVLWNRQLFAWSGLTRVQIMTSSLSVVLRALNSDLWDLLNQPLEHFRAA